MSTPYFSVVIPTYNRAQLIARSIDSCLAQTHTALEVIVVDDGSTDDTRAVVEQYTDSRVQYIYQENGERGKARNTGIAAANGQYVNFLDSDDWFLPHHLAAAKAFIEQHPAIEVFHQGFSIVNADDKVVEQPQFPTTGMLNAALLQGNVCGSLGVFMRRDVALAHPFSTDRRVSATEDWLLWLQLAARYPFRHHAVLTGRVLYHDGRSQLNFDVERLRVRTASFIAHLLADEVFVEKHGSARVQQLHAHMQTYMALFAALGKQRRAALGFWLQGVRLSPGELLTRRSLAIAKHLLLP